MKKLLSFIAAGALALGLIGCSGDLHDVELIDLTGYGLRGTLTGWAEADDVALVKQSDGSYTYSFTAKNDTENFAVLKMVDGTWNTAYRLAQPKAQGDTANVFSAAGDGKSGQSGMTQKVYLGQSADCMSIPDAKGKKVTIKVVPDTTFLNVTVTLEASSATVAADPTPFYLDGYYILGPVEIGGNATWAASVDTLLWGASVETKTGYVTYKYDFTAGDTSVQFGIGTKGWATKYTKGAFAFGTTTDYVDCTQGDNTNNSITGLTKDSSYRIYVRTTPEKKVAFKVVLLNKITVSVTASGLPAALDGAELYLTGNYNGWVEPGKDGTTKVTVANGSVTSSFEKILEGDETYEVQCKFASTGWTKPEICNTDKGNVSVTVSKSKYTVKGTFADVNVISGNAKASENGTQYLCSWKVE